MTSTQRSTRTRRRQAEAIQAAYAALRALEPHAPAYVLEAHAEAIARARAMLADGRLPYGDAMHRIIAEREEASQKDAARAAAEDRIERIQRAAVPLYEALKAIMHGTGMLPKCARAAHEALAKAEGRD